MSYLLISALQRKMTSLLVVVISAVVAVVVATNEKGTAFLIENAKKEGVITLPSGFQYKV